MKQVARLKLVIAYDGAAFRGWQSQRGGGTVQDQLEAALAKLAPDRPRIHGAGRTDTGVHALAQVAHCDVPRDRMQPQEWRRALNAHLPPTVRVLRVAQAPARFHARLDAIGKIYTYRIWNAEVLPPLELRRAWHLHTPLDIQIMRRAAALVTGTQNFAGFAANRGKPGENTTRTIRSIKIVRKGPLMTLRYDGNGFLYKMVRLLTGSIVRCGQGRAGTEWIAELLTGGGSQKSSFAAPAEGLYLARVQY